VLLGAELATALGAETGDRLRLVVLGFADDRTRFSYLTVEVVGTFRAGLSEFDREWAVIERRRLERLVEGRGRAPALLEFRLADPERAAERAVEIKAILGEDYLVSDWKSLNGELFTALEVQQIALFLVLGLIVLVSTFNVASTLVVLVRERLREVGVLAAIGMRPEALRALFVVYGLLLGAAGTTLGIALGAGLSWTLDALRVIRFNPEVAAIYFIDAVPFRVRGSELLAVAAFSLLANVLACLGPALRAARVDPVVALRYE
jgi:lipoprotein-releasing system permease protein